MKTFIIALIVSSVALSTATFACSEHRHDHKHSKKTVVVQPKK